ncbi:MAG: acetyltransferase, partial [Muribaculaceae bacterium]|nr:acetyltransferase [Muribaculaceae bacterium]
MKPLILIGGGGHCLSVIDAAESMGATIAGILDPQASIGDMIGGYPVVGDDNDIAPLAASGQYSFVVTLGSIKDPSRREILQKHVISKDGLLANIIASTAYVSPTATLGIGTVVLHKAIINAGASVGAGCIINSGAIIEHSAHIGDFAHISTGAIVNGDSTIGKGTFIGSGAVVSSQTNVCRHTVIGAGAVVVTDITARGIYVGVPAKKVRDIQEPL